MFSTSGDCAPPAKSQNCVPQGFHLHRHCINLGCPWLWAYFPTSKRRIEWLCETPVWVLHNHCRIFPNLTHIKGTARCMAPHTYMGPCVVCVLLQWECLPLVYAVLVPGARKNSRRVKKASPFVDLNMEEASLFPGLFIKVVSLWVVALL